MVVQQHVLNWLYSVLTSEYRDVNRAYNDVAQALSAYPSLAPRTDEVMAQFGVDELQVIEKFLPGMNDALISYRDELRGH